MLSKEYNPFSMDYCNVISWNGTSSPLKNIEVVFVEFYEYIYNFYLGGN